MTPDPHNWHPEIEGWAHDILPFYARMAIELPNYSDVVEVGVYKGRSCLFLADSVKGRSIIVHAVDTWDETDWASHRPDEAIYQEFLGHGRRLDVFPPVVVHRMTSKEAAVKFPSEFLYMVFIDASHTYEGVKADIGLWLPKVKPGGVIAGHDYSGSFPGVAQAVEEAFPGRVKVTDTVWEVRV